MKINRVNYEAFFLDYLEGKLDDSLRSQFRVFLEENPDLAGELEGLEEVSLDPVAPLNHPSKESLKKRCVPVAGIDEDTIEEVLVASMEGDLSVKEEQHLLEFLEKNPAYHYDRKLFEATIVMPDPDIVFPAKDRLRRRRSVLIPLSRIAAGSAAAIVALLLGWKLFLQPGSPDPAIGTSQIVQQEKPIQQDIPSTLEPLVARQVAAIKPPAIIRAGTEEVRPTRMDNLLTIPPRLADKLETSRTVPLIIPRFYTREALASLQPEAEPERPPTMAGRIIRGLSKRAQEGSELLQDVASGRERNVSFWDIADLGLQGYNMLADRDVELVVTKKTGEANEYTFIEDGRVLLNSPQNKE